MPTQEQILESLKQVKYPGFSRDIVSFGLVKQIAVDGGAVQVWMEVTTSDHQVPIVIQQDSIAALKSLQGVKSVDVQVKTAAPLKAVMGAGGAPVQQGIPGVRHILAVASGKGGVGKSTVAANLAAALSKQGLKVGLCDCDLYGPSIGMMFGTLERPKVTEDEKIHPIESRGLRLMSMSFLVEEEAPVILRGPMVTRYTQQFLRNVNWGDLDVLVLDLPPGTGDIQLTIVQTVALTGALVVTTPQEVALIDARKAVKMFERVNVPILGIVENMSYFICPDNGRRYDIFGTGGGKREAGKLGVPLLAEVPLEMTTRESGDAGLPVVLAKPETAAAKEFIQMAAKIKSILAATVV
ncbi:MAG: Mrp/NBP35 family ATP-binding protein [Methylacidiphilales bacterium]|nr:Mrp/NBP35 family ATP-binding protein [Candidatus Methylacidiphilales bacterium]